MFLVFLYCKAAHICWWRSKKARTQRAPVNINVCACQCVYVHGDVNLGILKKNKNVLIHLSLLIVYAALPVLCCALSASHSPDFIFFPRVYRAQRCCWSCVFFNILPVVVNHVFALIFVNNLYSLHVGQPITRLLSSPHFFRNIFLCKCVLSR